MQMNQELVIILPENMKDIPVRVICDNDTKEISVKIISRPASNDYPETGWLHTTIYNQEVYTHVPMSEIMWIEANGSYCYVHTAKGQKIMLSFPLGHIQKALPANAFIWIHRSFLINIDHIKAIHKDYVVV